MKYGPLIIHKVKFVLFQMLALPYLPVLFTLIISVFGICGFGQFPIALELAVETTYPIGEASSSGFLLLLGYGVSQKKLSEFN